MFEAGNMDTVRRAIRSNEYFSWLLLFSALEYIDELFDLLTKNEDVQISENISEEMENIKVCVRRQSSFEDQFFPYSLEWTEL